ncbi:hypothetical protein LTR16_000791 [Cryomyces antarcticus]|uniref:WW domain-containing protein n=1 Tax=Cryomyces antarcticus TaxID=329879 RepID=A0ABR0LQR4_9PEZI|nr:hypothetical protein LTR39_001743 [Cryomyces antarcticus]KAK5020608.1 hypothetical protein LTR60_000365 [Cryomyces antarcticus]KAK5201982.1 hypothetical protein LTR16_000791 [Cryomyces antarcticus]
MSASFTHHISYSWLPSLHLFNNVTPSQSTPPEIDEDPFAHFISPVVEEDDPFDNLAYSAGIVTVESEQLSKVAVWRARIAEKWAKYVARNREDLHWQYHDNKDRLYRTILVEPEPLSPGSSSPSIVVTDFDEGPVRGRALEILPQKEKKRPRRGRASRTLSGHRHSWREPSVDLFTVLEEKESPEQSRVELGRHQIADGDGRKSKEKTVGRARL